MTASGDAAIRRWCELRYLINGTVVHIIGLTGSWPLSFVALCGVSPDVFAFGESGWYGTGSQVEYECAALLPVCRRCRDLMAR
jgi:hypothetical protein